MAAKTKKKIESKLRSLLYLDWKHLFHNSVQNGYILNESTSQYNVNVDPWLLIKHYTCLQLGPPLH